MRNKLSSLILAILAMLAFLFLLIFLNKNETSEKVDLRNIKLISPLENKTKKDYEEKENLLDKVLTVDDLERNLEKKENDFEIDGSIGIDKDTNNINEIKINIGTKF